MEWYNPYNSFNSMKGMAYHENYRKISEWMDGRGELPPPIECNLDPIAVCNLDCSFCIVQRYIKHNRGEIGDMVKLPLDYMKRLVDFLVDWGVKGLCISGGGEPTLHNGLPELLEYAHGKLDLALVTNGTKVFPEMLYARWVAISVDAATRDTYKLIKGKDKFDEVCDNIRWLSDKRRDGDADLCFKFLLTRDNQMEIEEASKLAFQLGVQDFHVRPADLERKDMDCTGLRPDQLGAVNWQMERCHDIDTEGFRVYTVIHKFAPDFRVKHDFPACLASPLIFPILSDGNGYICVEHKMEEKYRLGSAYPDPENILTWWGGERHREIVKNITPETDCSRCVYSEYHKQIVATREDLLCLAFP